MIHLVQHGELARGLVDGRLHVQVADAARALEPRQLVEVRREQRRRADHLRSQRSGGLSAPEHLSTTTEGRQRPGRTDSSGRGTEPWQVQDPAQTLKIPQHST